MDKKVEYFVINAIRKLINHTASDEKIKSLIYKHKKKIHFIPIRYRILGGILQSMNIQFGNFIEELLHIIVENEKQLSIVPPSGKRNIELPMTYISDRLIDEYITNRQTDKNYQTNLLNSFERLLNELFEIERKSENKEISVKHDIDVLFRNRENKLFYLEVKYNDDHDTGKFVNINRKFIKTYIGLCNVKNIYNLNKFKPILYFLTPKIMKGNIYLPEPKYIYRGQRLFDEFFSLKYSDLDSFMASIGDNEDIKLLFDNLYSKIRSEIVI